MGGMMGGRNFWDWEVDGVGAGWWFGRFPALVELGGWLRHGMVGRVAGVEVSGERDEVLGRLRWAHERVVQRLGYDWRVLTRAEQVHGAEVGWVERREGGEAVVAGVDGLATAEAGRVLGIYVADCCAVFVVDPIKQVVGLLHSGRRGSERGMMRQGIAVMAERAGCRAADMVVQLSPCIRPPQYEVDFADWIRREARACGVPSAQIHDGGECTASDLDRFYSYRAERGRTGRMLALLGIAADSSANELRDRADQLLVCP